MSTPRAISVQAGLRWGMALAALAVGSAVSAQVVELLPNMQPFPAQDVILVQNAAGGLDLRFSTTSWNSGAGPMELVAGETGPAGQNVYQRVYLSDGSHYDRLAGTFEWDGHHDHFHFQNYANYILDPVAAPGGSQRTSSKTSFCLLDNVRVDTSLPGAPGSPVYATCGADIQGISVGWGDTYGRHLAGQSFDFTGNPSGDYDLTIEIDPFGRLLETSDGDNASCVRVRVNVASLTATVLGDCGAPVEPVVVSAITPSSMRRGTVVAVTITGSGFAPGMQVSFEGGSGPRPTASNVVFQNANSVTANVTVKSGGAPRPRVWDVRVGSGLLAGGFTVLP